MPKLSIITINYNNDIGLKKTIESVINQTFENFEYIIIDGASTDQSVSIISQYRDKITYWVSEKDRGIFNAMNKGILKANGDYIMFLNSGDWLANHEVLDEIFKFQFKEDIVYGNMIKVYKDDQLELDKGFQRSELTLSDMYFHTINHSSSLIKKTLFDKFGLYNESYKIVSDWLFYLKVVGIEGVPVKYVDITFNYFDKSGISSTQLQLRNKERIRGIRELLPQSIINDYEELGTLRNRIKVLDIIEKKKFSTLAFKAFKKIF